jgi:hypothetical protein
MRTPVSVHKKIISSLAVIALVVLLGMTGTAEAQYRGGRVVVAPRVVVGGGYYYRPYFYDPFWFDPWYGFASTRARPSVSRSSRKKRRSTSTAFTPASSTTSTAPSSGSA